MAQILNTVHDKFADQTRPTTSALPFHPIHCLLPPFPSMNIVIIAADMCKRMQSTLSKVLHPFTGKLQLGIGHAAAQTIPQLDD